MSHQVPRDYKNDNRLFEFKKWNLFFTSRGLIYALIVSAIAYVFYLIFRSSILFLILLIVFNVLVYPLGQSTIPNSKFEGGGTRRDVMFIRKLKYKFSKKKIYLRVRK